MYLLIAVAMYLDMCAQTFDEAGRLASAASTRLLTAALPLAGTA